MTTVVAKVLAFISDDIVAPFFQKFGSKIESLLSGLNKIGLISDEKMKSAKANLDALSKGTGASFEKLADQMNAIREKELEKDRKALDQKSSDIDEYYKQSKAQFDKEDEDLKKRDEARMRASNKNLAAMQDRVKAAKAKQAEEVEKIRAAKALLAESKKAGEAQLTTIITTLSDQLKVATAEGRKADIAKIQKKLDNAQVYLERIRDSVKTERVAKNLAFAQKLVAPDQSKDTATTPSPATMPPKPGAPAPAAAAVGAGTMKTAAAPAAKPQDMTVKSQVNGVVGLKLKGDAAKFIEQVQSFRFSVTGLGMGVAK